MSPAPRFLIRGSGFLCLTMLTACSSSAPPVARVRVVARDYSFGVPASLPAGETYFQLVNEGTVRHEIQLYRFRPGVTRDSALHLIASDDFPDSVVDVDGGVLISGPNDSAVQQLVAPLHSGDVYGLECAFRNGSGQPVHSKLGMFSVFEVK
ncbi:MAG: hypothetical protein ABI742_13010 [Gemmatimonadota bacterium]